MFHNFYVKYAQEQGLHFSVLLYTWLEKQCLYMSLNLGYVLIADNILYFLPSLTTVSH
jgi:hypothetical protein